MILRDRDANTLGGWEDAADSVLEERIFYCQNWRADVVALLDSAGGMLQHVRYGEYGDPFGIHAGDADGDGDCDDGLNTDATDQIATWALLGYDVRGDLNLDGNVNSTDQTRANRMAGTVLGWGVLSRSDCANRKGYAGYETDHIVAAVLRLNHVRNRVYNVTLGRWMTRDPIGYVDGWNLYEYVISSPIAATDPLGMMLYGWQAARAIGTPIQAPSDDNMLAFRKLCDLPSHGVGINPEHRLPPVESPGELWFIPRALGEEMWEQKGDIAMSLIPWAAPLRALRSCARLGRWGGLAAKLDDPLRMAARKKPRTTRTGGRPQKPRMGQGHCDLHYKMCMLIGNAEFPKRCCNRLWIGKPDPVWSACMARHMAEVFRRCNRSLGKCDGTGEWDPPDWWRRPCLQ